MTQSSRPGDSPLIDSQTRIATVRCRVRTGAYFDSLALMRAAAAVQVSPGVVAASLMMGTDANKEILREAGLLTPEAAGAGANDLIVAVSGDSAVLDAALEAAEAQLRRGGSGGSVGGSPVADALPRTLVQARRELPELTWR